MVKTLGERKKEALFGTYPAEEKLARRAGQLHRAGCSVDEAIYYAQQDFPMKRALEYMREGMDVERAVSKAQYKPGQL